MVEKKYKNLTAVCTTTINVPKFFDDVCKNAKKYGHKDIVFFVIGDYKTPKNVDNFLVSLEKKYNFPFEYFNIRRQKKFLRDFQVLDKLLPYNWGGRKMLANFIAFKMNCKRIIMLDDDNFVLKKDFFGFHKISGSKKKLSLFQSSNGWFNVYESLIEKNKVFFYPRSFPWKYRFVKNKIKITKKQKKIGIVNGLVLNDPDIDAISRLFWPIYVTRVKKNYLPNYGLYKKTWCSWNNQNTSMSKSLFPCYFTPPSAGRNSDIWTAYVMCKICDSTGDVISFGEPLVEQRRNPHNLWNDLEDELINNISTDFFCEMLRSIKITEKKPLKILDELIEKSIKYISKNEPSDERIKTSIKKYFFEYRIWKDLIIKNNDFL